MTTSIQTKYAQKLLALTLLIIASCKTDQKVKHAEDLPSVGGTHQELKQGPETTWFSETKIKSVVKYREGKKDDSAIYWDSTGSLWAVINYSDDTIEHVANYHPNGNKSLDVFYKNGKHHGISTRWNQEGKLISKVLFKNGKIDSMLYPEKMDSTAIVNDKELLMLIH